MIKEIVANIKTNDLEILFRMDSGYFDEEIIQTIESLNCEYLIKAKAYPTLTTKVINSQIPFVKGDEGRETIELFTKLNAWEKERRFVVLRVLKPEKVVVTYEKRGNAENYIKEAKYDMYVGHHILKSLWANEAVFQMIRLFHFVKTASPPLFVGSINALIQLIFVV